LDEAEVIDGFAADAAGDAAVKVRIVLLERVQVGDHSLRLITPHKPTVDVFEKF
jgi:hypothetical protein